MCYQKLTSVNAINNISGAHNAVDWLIKHLYWNILPLDSCWYIRESQGWNCTRPEKKQNMSTCLKILKKGKVFNFEFILFGLYVDSNYELRISCTTQI